MPHAQPALLIVHSDETSYAVEPGQGVVTIGREPHADVQIDDPTISQEHLRAECADRQWRVVDNSPSGMFVDGSRRTSVAVTGKGNHPVRRPRHRQGADIRSRQAVTTPRTARRRHGRSHGRLPRRRARSGPGSRRSSRGGTPS